MPPQTRTFGLNFCAVSLSSITFSGLADGDGVTMSFPNDDFEVTQGSDGHAIWVRKHNVVADVVIRLGQGNPQIAQVRQLHLASLALDGILYAFNAINLKSTDEVVSGQAMIKKTPDIKWGDSAQAAEIMLGVTATIFAGGTYIPG